MRESFDYRNSQESSNADDHFVVHLDIPLGDFFNCLSLIFSCTVAFNYDYDNFDWDEPADRI